MVHQSGGRPPMGAGKKLAIGVAVLICAPVFIAGAISGARDSISSTASPVAAPPASPAPKPATSTAVAASRPTPRVQIDQDGDDTTTCAMTYAPTPDGKGTIVRFTVGHAGELITHLNGPQNQNRHDQQVAAGSVSFTDDVALSDVTGAGAILQDPYGTRHVCSIAPAH